MKIEVSKSAIGFVLAIFFLHTLLLFTLIIGPGSVTGLEESLPSVARFALIFSSFFIGYGLTCLTIAYFLQKFMVRLAYHVYKLILKGPNFFFQANTNKKKLSVVRYTLWLILLPFPMEYVISMGPAEIAYTELKAAFFLPATLAIFVLWGLRASALVGTTEDNVFRLSEMLHSALYLLTVMQ